MSSVPRAGATVLLVEDDEPVRLMMKVVLARAGFHVETACDGESALAMIASLPVDAIVVDLMMPAAEGKLVISEAASRWPRILARTIVTTAAANTVLSGFDSSRLFALVRKPFDIESFVETVRRCARQRESRTRQRHASREVPDGTDADRPFAQTEAVRRFVLHVAELRAILARTSVSSDEKLLRAELRRSLRELATLLGESARLEDDPLRATTARTAASIAAKLAKERSTS